MKYLATLPKPCVIDRDRAHFAYADIEVVGIEVVNTNECFIRIGSKTVRVDAFALVRLINEEIGNGRDARNKGYRVRKP